ncbi:hypothetical protein BU17DRAFT_83445 [Hysterangium stoloniferum]|nr:hypothetical protein BU17DRAFT_83445 [Hysterangium stoloniferum]
MPQSTKRKSEGQDGRKKRANYAVTSRTNIDGPGVWATCDKGREKSAIGELYDLFESIADQLWPVARKGANDGSAEDDVDQDSDTEDDLEAQIKKEVEGLKRPRVEKRFANRVTGTPCVVFISCKAPIDPVKLVMHHFENVERSGITRTKHVLRLTPASGSCVASTPEISVLAQKIIPPAFASLALKTDGSKKYRYKLELTFRSHDKLKKSELIPLLVEFVPSDVGHVVDLEHPEIVIFVQILKSVCSMSVVQHYERFKRFNVVQVGDSARRDMEPATTLQDNISIDLSK